MIMHTTRTVAAIALLLTVSSCGTDAPSIDPPNDGVGLDGAWVLASGSVDGSAVPLDERYRVTMTIDGDAISGRAACNTYGGPVTIDGSDFVVGDLFSTMMGCEPDVMEVESQFTTGLARVTRAERSDDALFLTGAGVTLDFALVPPVPAADLIGVTWILDTIIEGDTATSTVAGTEPAALRLDPDGTFAAGTGCRSLAGDYIVTGDTVQVTSFGAAGECTPVLERQDNQVISVLEGGFTTSIDGDRLTIIAPGGEGLSYRAG